MRTPKIPKGWRKLRASATLKPNDKWWNPSIGAGWQTTEFPNFSADGQFYIRRAQPRRHAGKGKKKI